MWAAPKEEATACGGFAAIGGGGLPSWRWPSATAQEQVVASMLERLSSITAGPEQPTGSSDERGEKVNRGESKNPIATMG